MVSGRRKRSPWFRGDVKPAHVGVYEWAGSTDNLLPYPFHYWDGTCWHLPDDSPSGALKEPVASESYKRSLKTWQWRGLANPPKEQP